MAVYPGIPRADIHAYISIENFYDGMISPMENKTPNMPDASFIQKNTSEDTPTVIVMHASVGSGHRSAARAVAEAFEILRDSKDAEMLKDCEIPSNLNVEVVDILDQGRIVFDGDKTATMFTGATRPFYDLTWRYVLTGHILWGGGTIWSRIMYPKFSDYVKVKNPIAIVCTHITAANVAAGARMLTGLNYPILCVPTDYEIEGLWPHRVTDLFCVANEAMAETLRPRKVAEQDILITGIPTRNDFTKSYNKQATRTKLGLPHDKMVVLTLAGAYLSQPYVLFREILDTALPSFHLYPEMHFVFIAGNDSEYAKRIREKCDEHDIKNVTVFDYVEEMAALMTASDLVICKSGGLTVTECLCAQVPMILLGKTYGQEKSNRRMLTAMGAALHVTTARELLATLAHITRHPNSIDAMAISGKILHRPDAALDIARAAFKEAEKSNDKSNKEQAKKRKKRFLWFYWGKKPAHTR